MTADTCSAPPGAGITWTARRKSNARAHPDRFHRRCTRRLHAELAKFLDLAKDNAATAIKEPGVREFNITQLASNPNHVVFYEVYDNEAALTAHRATDHFKNYRAATANMVADRNVRAMAAVEFHSAGH